MIILKIAFRNLWEHKAKTLIVGLLIALGAFLLVAGNSLLESIDAGMHRSFSANYTGDLVLLGEGKGGFSLMPGPIIEGGIPLIPDFASVKARIDETPGVAASLPVLSGIASLAVDENAVGISFLWAADYSDYRTMFPDSLELVAGQWPAETRGTIMLSQDTWDSASKEAKREIKIGEKLTLTGIGGVGMKIREVTLSGVFKFKRGGEMLDMISMVDPDTMRSLSGITGTSIFSSANASVADSGISGSIDEAMLFGGDSLTTIAALDGYATDFNTLLGDTSVRDKYVVGDPDAWHFLLVRLQDPQKAADLSIDLNRWGRAKQEPVITSDWKWAAGQQAQLVDYLRVVFIIAVAVIIVVVAIIIMNTMVISITERFPEIGTMRAIGAKKPFVRSMIMAEALVIAAIFGVIGTAAGSLAIAILGVTGIEGSGQFLSLLFGGAPLHPTISGSSVLSALAAVIFIGMGSCLYPMSIALRVTPLRAMQR